MVGLLISYDDYDISFSLFFFICLTFINFFLSRAFLYAMYDRMIPTIPFFFFSSFHNEIYIPNIHVLPNCSLLFFIAVHIFVYCFF